MTSRIFFSTTGLIASWMLGWQLGNWMQGKPVDMTVVVLCVLGVALFVGSVLRVTRSIGREDEKIHTFEASKKGIE